MDSGGGGGGVVVGAALVGWNAVDRRALPILLAPAVTPVVVNDATGLAHLTCSLHGVVPGHTYDVALIALPPPAPATGTPLLVAVVPLTWRCEVPDAPASLLLVKPQRTSLRLRWMPPAHDGGEPVVTYEVQACRVSVPSAAGDEGAHTGVVGGDEEADDEAADHGPVEEVVMAASGIRYAWRTVYRGPERVLEHKGLAPGRNYALRVAAVNRLGRGPYTPASLFRTEASVPTPPTALTASAASPTSVHLTWSPPAATNGAPVYEYVVDVAPGAPPAGLTFVVAARVEACECDVTALAADATYSFRVLAVNGAGASAPSAIIVAATTAEPLPTPTGVRVSAAATGGGGGTTLLRAGMPSVPTVDATTATLAWDAPPRHATPAADALTAALRGGVRGARPGAPAAEARDAVRHIVEVVRGRLRHSGGAAGGGAAGGGEMWAPAPVAGHDGMRTLTAAPGVTTLPLTGLTPGSLYLARVAAASERAGTSAFSAWTPFHTAAGAPAAPRIDTCRATVEGGGTRGAVELHATVPDTHGAPVAGVRVYVYHDGPHLSAAALGELAAAAGGSVPATLDEAILGLPLPRVPPAHPALHAPLPGTTPDLPLLVVLPTSDALAAVVAATSDDSPAEADEEGAEEDGGAGDVGEEVDEVDGTAAAASAAAAPLAVGMSVDALHDGDGVWYPATVTAVSAGAAADDSSSVTVQLSGLGVELVLPPASVRRTLVVGDAVLYRAPPAPPLLSGQWATAAAALLSTVLSGGAGDGAGAVLGRVAAVAADGAVTLCPVSPAAATGDVTLPANYAVALPALAAFASALPAAELAAAAASCVAALAAQATAVASAPAAAPLVVAAPSAGKASWRDVASSKRAGGARKLTVVATLPAPRTAAAAAPAAAAAAAPAAPVPPPPPAEPAVLPGADVATLSAMLTDAPAIVQLHRPRAAARAAGEDGGDDGWVAVTVGVTWELRGEEGAGGAGGLVVRVPGMLLPGHQYRCRLVVSNAAGSSAASTPAVCQVPPAAPPARPLVAVLAPPALPRPVRLPPTVAAPLRLSHADACLPPPLDGTVDVLYAPPAEDGGEAVTQVVIQVLDVEAAAAAGAGAPAPAAPGAASEVLTTWASLLRSWLSPHAPPTASAAVAGAPDAGKRVAGKPARAGGGGGGGGGNSSSSSSSLRTVYDGELTTPVAARGWVALREVWDAVPADQPLFSARLTGLAPGRAFLVRLRTANSCGASPWSAWVAAYTTARRPAAPMGVTAVPVPVPLAAAAASDAGGGDTAALAGLFGCHWRVAGEGVVATWGPVSDDGGAPITAYECRVSVAPLPGVAAVEPVMADTCPPTRFVVNPAGTWRLAAPGEGGSDDDAAAVGSAAVVVTPLPAALAVCLPPSSQVFVAVRARNDAGWGSWSKVAEATTRPDAPLPPAAPVPLLVGATNARLALALPRGGDARAPVLGFEVRRLRVDGDAAVDAVLASLPRAARWAPAAVAALVDTGVLAHLAAAGGGNETVSEEEVSAAVAPRAFEALAAGWAAERADVGGELPDFDAVRAAAPPAASAASVGVRMQRLAPAASYAISAVAYNVAGRSAPSPWLLIHTAPEPAAPAAPASAAVGATAAGEAPDRSKANSSNGGAGRGGGGGKPAASRAAARGAAPSPAPRAAAAPQEKRRAAARPPSPQAAAADATARDASPPHAAAAEDTAALPVDDAAATKPPASSRTALLLAVLGIVLALLFALYSGVSSPATVSAGTAPPRRPTAANSVS